MTRSPNLMSFDGDAARPALALCAALRHLPVVLALGAVACGAAPSSELGRHRIDPAALTDGAWREAPGAGAELRLEHTLQNGQCFGWQRQPGDALVWAGVLGAHLLELQQTEQIHDVLESLQARR